MGVRENEGSGNLQHDFAEILSIQQDTVGVGGILFFRA